MGALRRSELELELPLGQLFADRYQIERLLGRGGMGAVYLARDLCLGEDIALKVLSFGSEPPPAAVLRFRQEVKLARRVTHPNVARVYDIGEQQGLFYLTMEYVDSGTLRTELRRERRLTPGRAVAIARAICEGLDAAHAAGVVHRDLKPGNVLIDHGGRVVLSDFGIARCLTEESELTTGVIGTPYYMAPEQAASGLVDARADLYNVGLLLFEMLTGEHTQGGPREAEGALMRLGVQAALVALVVRCLQPSAAARPQSARGLARALGEAGTPLENEPARTRREPAPKPAGEAITAVRPASPVLHTGALGDPALAVLPFRYRGSKENDYLGDAITDELVDVLSRTRGLSVLGSGATARFRDARDPRTIGAELGAFAIIDGTVQMTHDKVRISVRLIDVERGVQLWSDHYEGSLEDLFAFQETIARRVAEALRVEITTLTRRGDATSEAIEHYLMARRRLRDLNYASATEAVAGFERCLALSPTFTPALASHAIASVRAWFYDIGADPSPRWEEESRASVARALESAPELCETQLAAAMRATQCGDYPTAARSLARSLAIAPTFADAHEYLGVLQCEAGQGDAGAARLKLADELNPTLPFALIYIARQSAFRGRFEESEATLDEFERRRGIRSPMVSIIRVRNAAWRRDREALARWAADGRHGASAAWQPGLLYAQALLGQFDEAGVERVFMSLLAGANNPRRISLALQLLTEVHAGCGKLEAARRHLVRAADNVLVDLEWIDHCPLLKPLRALPDFDQARRQVQARAEAIWTF